MTKEELEQKRRDGIDAIIDKFQIDKKTGIDRETIHNRISKAVVLMNLSHVLSDVIDTMLLDVDGILRPFAVEFNQEDKRQVKQAMKYIKDAKICLNRVTKAPYDYDDADEFAADSDWWYNFIRCAHDRTGMSVQKTRLLLEYVLNMPSEMNMFDVKYKDFRRTLL
jgi:hypothetical protein